MIVSISPQFFPQIGVFLRHMRKQFLKEIQEAQTVGIHIPNIQLNFLQNDLQYFLFHVSKWDEVDQKLQLGPKYPLFQIV